MQKFTPMVVNVKKMLIRACRILWYWNFINGFRDSKVQKKAIPPAIIKALCDEGIDVK
jgi:hypothetical protein